MDKKEFIEKLIGARKESTDIAMLCVCEKINCQECPYFESNHCSFDIIDDLLDYIINNELERQETNFDHYIVRSGVHITKEHDVEAWEFRFKKGTEKQYFDADSKSVLDWLLAPYEEPKPKYKLTRFEFDFIKAFQEAYGDHSFLEWAVIRAWQKKGYLKGVPLELEVKTIMDNAEVIQND